MELADDELLDYEDGPSIREYTLTERSELRLECPDDKDVLVQLLEGSAEIFGAEVQLGSSINVKGQKLAVFSWTGCKLKVDGRPKVSYVAEDTPMPSYLQLHTQLNQMREAARQRGSTSGSEDAAELQARQGPRVLLVGPTDSGKSSLSRMLLNWAVRSGWEPTYVDLDVGQGSITVPGCISAVPIEAPVEHQEGYSSLDMPLVLFYGHASAGDNPELYKFLLDRMAAILDKRAKAQGPGGAPTLAATSGLIINTLGWTEGLGYELQLHAINSFQVDVVVVLEQDRLHSQLSAELKGRPIQVLKLQKSGGVVKREREERRAARDGRVRDYFYGSSRTLMPVTQFMRADQLKVFRIGGGPRAPTTALPIGAVPTAADPLKLAHVPVATDLVQSLLAVTHAEKPDQVLSSNVAGFILIKEMDTIKNTVMYMAPCPGPLPGQGYLLSGSLRFSVE